MDRQYRPLLALSGLLLLAGGSMHPEADPAGSVRDDLAEMTADPTWVSGHALTAMGTLLLAAGLWALHRRGGVPARTARALRTAAAAVSLYVVETLFHLAAAVDEQALAAGDTGVVAGTHMVLSAVLYPVSGAALALLGRALLLEGRGARRTIAAFAVVGGTLHALAVPFVLLLPDADGSPLFAGGAVLIAAWGLMTALAGLPASAPDASATPVLQPTR